MALMQRRPMPDVTGHATPERAALAHAIAAHAAAVATVAATAAAGDQASNAVYDAHAAVTAAQEGVIAAREATMQHIIAAAGGDTGPAPRTERQARDALKGRLPDAERDRDTAARRRTDAARAVIASEAAAHVAALVLEVGGLQRNAVAKGAALAWLAKAGAVETVQRIGGEYGRPADSATRAAVDRHNLVMQQAVTGDGLHQAAAGAAPWDAALAALERDADAPLPSTGA